MCENIEGGAGYTIVPPQFGVELNFGVEYEGHLSGLTSTPVKFKESIQYLNDDTNQQDSLLNFVAFISKPTRFVSFLHRISNGIGDNESNSVYAYQPSLRSFFSCIIMACICISTIINSVRSKNLASMFSKM